MVESQFIYFKLLFHAFGSFYIVLVRKFIAILSTSESVISESTSLTHLFMVSVTLLGKMHLICPSKAGAGEGGNQRCREAVVEG